MTCWPASITDLHADADVLRRWRSGMIDVRAGRLVRVAWRPLPKLVSHLGARTVGRWLHGHKSGDVCRLYYHQPRACPEFLVLSYVVSYRDTSFATFRRAVEVLDEIAAVRGTYAIVCQVTNQNISHRLLSRWGWEQHVQHLFGRNYIKRLREFGRKAESEELRAESTELLAIP
ncbi:MAG TPA: hypothetical protein VHV77_17045 [Pirellulales bacterium]|jgi:hypothetical protein|nr:hypothetical protein [Pirellulales bacterium]